ncbi:MAG: DUF3892 domain-containing protein [Actinomadura sp.]
MDEIPIRVRIWRLFCFHGADEESSEPFLWVVGFKFDGSTLRQQLNRFQWTPDLFFGSGSHGNLGDAVDPGQKVPVPPAVGTWETSLKPLVLTDTDGDTIQVPGIIGFAAVLLEENNIPDHASDAGHEALNTFVANALETFVTGLDLTEINDAVAQLVKDGVQRDQALQDVLQPRLDALQQGISDGASDAVEAAIRDAMDLPESIYAAIDKDEVMGRAFHRATAQELIAERDFTIDYTDEMFDDPGRPEAGEFAYHLHSLITAKVRWKPIAAQLPIEHDIQIQGIEQKFSRDLGMFYISEIGGVAGGQPWWLSRSEAAALIAEGTRDFFVLTADGRKTPVLAVKPRDSYWAYLTTPPDERTDNNLLSLPKLRVVPGFHRAVLEPDPFA